MNHLLATAWLPSGADLRLFSPELILVGTIALVLLVPLLVGRRSYMAAMVSVLGALTGMLLTAMVLPQLVAGAGQGALTPPGTAPLLFADRFTIFFKMFLFLLLALIAWLWMIGQAHRDESNLGDTNPSNAHEFFVLLLTSALGMLLMVSTLNLLVIIIAIETASLPSYAIVASDKRSRLGAEAALKYVMFGAASAAIMVYGASLLYGRYATLDLSAIAAQVAQPGVVVAPVFWLGLAALGVGIAFKIAAVPMHLWCPDVFEGAPIEVTTWLSIASKAAGLGLLLRIVDVFALHVSHAGPTLQPLAWGIGAIAAITCTVGNLAALRQVSVKRILAYSSIAHAGYMMMAAAILAPVAGGANPAVNVGMAAVVAYLFVYVTMNVGAFGATALVVWQTGTDHLSAFSGLGRRAPWLALPMAVCLFSLVGLPPLGGFAAKWFLLIALGKTAAVQPWLWTLVIVAVVNTAISLYYYVRIVRQMYLVDDGRQPAFSPPVGGLAMVNVCAIVLLLLGTLWFSPLGRRAETLASYIFEQSATEQRLDTQSPSHGLVDRGP